MKYEDLTDWQKKFIDGLREEEWIVEEPIGDEEPELSETDKARIEIESASDCERLIIRPSRNNDFNNISTEILRSSKLNKQVTFLYKYEDLIRDGKLVGREGGVNESIIEEYKHEKMDELKERCLITM